MKACVVDWLDHYVDPADTAWVPMGDIKPEPVRVRTVGFVVKETDALITIAHTTHEDEAIGVFHILRSTITQLRYLSLPALPSAASKQKPVAASKRGKS